MCHRIAILPIFLTICWVFCFAFESKAQKIKPSQLEINAEEGDVFFGRLRILFPPDTIQLEYTEHDRFIEDSYYDRKSFILITIDKYGNHILNAGEKISGKWVHDIRHYNLTSFENDMELIELQIIDAVTILVTTRYLGYAFRNRPEREFSFRTDGDEPGNQYKLKTSILRICKSGIREYSYQGLGTPPRYYHNEVILPQSNRPDK
jgi:hypothetical protein